jgi:hypothetical protein
MAYIIPLVLTTTGIFPNKLHETLQPLNLSRAQYILTKNAVIHYFCCIVRKFLAEK